MHILLDSNVFWGDVYAEKPWLSTVLKGAKQGDFDLVVPETVIRELVKQFPERLSEAVQANHAASKKLRPFGIGRPADLEVDELTSSYEPRLRKRLTADGCRIKPDPTDVGQLVDWAVAKRRPFKSSGQGLPDAVIWLTALNLAKEGAQVLLVSTNTEDFGDGSNEPALAPELVADLDQLQIGRDKIKLVTNVKQLVDEIVAPMAAAEARAERLAKDPDLSERIKSALDYSLLYAPLPRGELRLGVELDSDPEPIAMDVLTLKVGSVREADDGELFIRMEALCDLHLEMAIFKGDLPTLQDDSPVAIEEEPLNEHYAQGEAEITAWVTVDLNTDPAGEDVEVNVIVNAQRLSDEEELMLRLERGALDPLLDAIRDPSGGGEMAVDNYVPDVPLESDVDQATVEQLYPSAAHVESIDGVSREGVSCSLVVRCEADVTWVVTAPSGFDSDRYPWLSESPDEGGWLSDVESRVPLLLFLSGTLSPAGEWLDLKPDGLMLARDEVDRRVRRREAVDDDELECLQEARQELSE